MTLIYVPSSPTLAQYKKPIVLVSFDGDVDDDDDVVDDDDIIILLKKRKHLVEYPLF